MNFKIPIKLEQSLLTQVYAKITVPRESRPHLSPQHRVLGGRAMEVRALDIIRNTERKARCINDALLES